MRTMPECSSSVSCIPIPARVPSASDSPVNDSHKDKKRRRRMNHRQMKSNSSVQGGIFGSVDSVSCGPSPESSRNLGSGEAASVPEEKMPSRTFRSLPSMHMSSGNSSRDSAVVAPMLYSSPIDLAVAPTVPMRHFASHWPAKSVTEAVKKGNVFIGKLRVNAHNILEAYCTIEGLPLDILINGFCAQNRALDGDIVAVKLDPVANWTKIKGGNMAYNSTAEGVCKMPEAVATAEMKCTSKAKAVPNGFHSRSCNGFPNVSSGVNLEDLNAAKCSMSARVLERINALMKSNPAKRPVGKVVSIIKRSPHCEAVVGLLGNRPECSTGYVYMVPMDSKFPKMLVDIESFPDSLKERLENGDGTVRRELVAARLNRWDERSLFPDARLIHVLGDAREIRTHLDAILLENAIYSSKFPADSIACLPDLPWEIPEEEIRRRKDMRSALTFTIDPCSAAELDDALSLDIVSEGLFRVGVHIADVSYFVSPDSALDAEAQVRSTSVYMLQHKLSMLPYELSEGLASLNPGVDRLTFSVTWDIDSDGNIVDRWVGRSVISSCCKMSYDFVQTLIDENFSHPSITPLLYGNHTWDDVVKSLKGLYEISKKLEQARFQDGAVSFNNMETVMLFDQGGAPCSIFRIDRKEACSLVEEFMLLANRSIAEIISSAYPDRALLRRHPEPNCRKLNKFKTLCSLYGFEPDVSTSHQLNLSLADFREQLKEDPVLLDLLVFHASKLMQPAVYFCTGDWSDDKDSWGHYALAIPFYTHFTSPLRRYPDIIVHRILQSVIEAEKSYCNWKGDFSDDIRCFTGLCFDKAAAESAEGRELLLATASELKVPGSEMLSKIATYCNERRVATRNAEEAVQKLYLWALLKEEIIFSEARVLSIGPRFMSVYVDKLTIERQINYDEVEGLMVDWLETTGTLILNIRREATMKKSGSAKCRDIKDVAFVADPSEAGLLLGEEYRSSSRSSGGSKGSISCFSDRRSVAPAVFPMVLRPLSAIPVALHSTGGEDGPVDFSAKLFVTSYHFI